MGSKIWSTIHPQFITDLPKQQVSALRRIKPLLREPNSCWYRGIKDCDKIDSWNQSLLWNAKPDDRRMVFGPLDEVEIVTFHRHSGVFYKPSFAEVYASIVKSCGNAIDDVHFFCLHDADTRSHRIGDYDFRVCSLFGTPVVVEYLAAVSAVTIQ